MNFGLDGEEQLVVSTIRRLVDKEIREWAADADRKGEPPGKLFEIAGEVGFMLDAVPAEADGLLEDDYSHLTRALRSLELGRGCAALAALLETNVEPALAVGRWGSEPAKAALFGSLSDGGLAATAHDFYGRLGVRAVGDKLILSGTIGPLPALARATHVLVAAYAGDAGTERGHPVLFLLDLEAGGIEREALAMSGWRAALWATASLSGATVEPAMILSRGEAASEAIADVLAWYRTSLAARAAGVATAAMEHSRRYGDERIQFGTPIGQFESIARMADENETRAKAARLLVLEAAWQLDSGAAAGRDTASRARDFAADVVSRATIDAVQIYGGYGFVNDFPVEKLMRDARAFEVLLGNEALGRVLGGTK